MLEGYPLPPLAPSQRATPCPAPLPAPLILRLMLLIFSFSVFAVNWIHWLSHIFSNSLQLNIMLKLQWKSLENIQCFRWNRTRPLGIEVHLRPSFWANRKSMRFLKWEFSIRTTKRRICYRTESDTKVSKWIPWNLSFRHISFHDKRLQTML